MKTMRFFDVLEIGLSRSNRHSTLGVCLNKLKIKGDIIMKTKFNFKISRQTLVIGEETINTPEIHIQSEVEATVKELQELYALQKTALEEAPVLAEDFLKGLFEVYKTSMKLSEEMNKQEALDKTPVAAIPTYVNVPESKEDAAMEEVEEEIVKKKRFSIPGLTNEQRDEIIAKLTKR